MTLKSKCNYISQVVSMMDYNKSVKSILNSELDKQKLNSLCSRSNYLITINADSNSKIGKLTCSDSEYSCIGLHILKLIKPQVI